MLADLGADVVRVEAPGDDDLVRVLPPALPGVPVADLSSSLIAVAGILAALVGRSQGQKGVHVDVSMYDSAFALMVHHLAGLLAGGTMTRGEDVGLTGRDPNYRVYRCS